MGILSRLGKVVRSTGRATNSGFKNVAGSRAAMLGVMGTAALAGGVSSVVPAAVDANMDIAFGSPDADKYFVGKEISSRYLLGRAMGGGFGTMMQATDPMSAMTFSGGRNVPGAKATMIGGAIGGIGGTLGGAAIAGAMGGGIRGKIGGAILGGIVGGGAIGGLPLANAGMTLRDNQDFFSQAAYGRSVSNSTAAGLGAVGDIVLGMHNSRNGF